MRKAIQKVDLEKNRIYITVFGFMTADEAHQLNEDYREAIDQCKPGFTVLTDVRYYKPGPPEIQAILAEGPKMAQAAGCKKVARVLVETKPLGGMQIERLAKSSSSYPSRHFETIEEAEAYLDSDLDC